MAKKYFIVHFTGHANPDKCGQRDNAFFGRLAPLLKLGDVSRCCYWAGLGLKSSDKVALQVLGEIEAYNGGRIDGITFLIDGYSAGGITALRFARRVPDDQIAYIGLADSAFYRGETDFLMRTPGSTAYSSNENYYQTYQNSPDDEEIHDKITADGWKNYSLFVPSAQAIVKGYHRAAIDDANSKILDRMESIIKNDA